MAVFLSVSLYIGIKIGQPEMAQQTYSNWGGKSEAVSYTHLIPWFTNFWNGSSIMDTPIS